MAIDWKKRIGITWSVLPYSLALFLFTLSWVDFFSHPGSAARWIAVVTGGLLGASVIVKGIGDWIYGASSGGPQRALRAFASERRLSDDVRDADAFISSLSVHKGAPSLKKLSGSFSGSASFAANRQAMLFLTFLMSGGMASILTDGVAWLRVPAFILTLGVLLFGTVDGMTKWTEGHRDKELAELRENIVAQLPFGSKLGARGFSLQMADSANVRVAIRLGDFAWSAAPRVVDDESPFVIRMTEPSLDSALRLSVASMEDRLRLVACLPGDALRALVTCLRDGAWVESGWLVVETSATAKDLLTTITVWAQRGAALQEEFVGAGERSAESIIARHVAGATDEQSLIWLRDAIRRSKGALAHALADAWVNHDGLEERQGELLIRLEPATRAERAGSILVRSDSETARADALFGLAQAEPDLFRTQLQSWLDEDEISLIDTLARRAEWWRARAADWGHLLGELEPPEWARIAMARMLVVAGDDSSLARAAGLLAPALTDRRGNLLEHLRQMHEQLQDEAIGELVARQIQEEEKASEGRVGGLTVSAQEGAGAGLVSLTAGAEVEAATEDEQEDDAEEAVVEVLMQSAETGAL